jgi:hypothetical protein
VTRKAQRRILLIAVFSVVVVIYGIYYRRVPYFNTASYNQIVESYFRKVPNTRDSSYYVDVWKLWKKLGINPDSMRESESSDSQGHYIFFAKSGEVVRLDCDFASLEDTKLIALTKEYHCTQVLVFKRPAMTKGSDYVFSYFFICGLGEMADRSRVKLLEPEPDLKLLEISYRNNHGTGTCGFGKSIYRLGRSSAQCLLKTDIEGWAVDGGPSGYGYSCEFPNIEETWPKIGLTYFVEYVPWQAAGERPGEGLLNTYILNAHVELTWDQQSRIFKPSPNKVLSLVDIKDLLENPVEFLEKRIENMNYLSCPDCPITKRIRPQSECLRGWGL